MTMAMAIEKRKRLAGNESGDAFKCLTFAVGAEEYAIDILKIREIIGLVDVVAIPNLPDYVKGVINLRGVVIPVIDYRLRCGMTFKAYGKETCIIIINTSARLVGLAVDAVSEVMTIKRTDIAPHEEMDFESQGSPVLGFGKVKGKIVIILDIENVLAVDDLLVDAV